MRHVTLLAAAVVMAVALPAAQGKPDFSGSWVLDESKSTVPQMGGRPPGGGSGGPRGGMTARSVKVTQTAAELSRELDTPMGAVTRVYKLDGSESTNATPRGTTKSKSRWDNARLVTEGVTEVQGPNGPFSIEMTETISLDADGNLVVDTTTRTPMGDRQSKLVYKKSSER